MTARDIKRKVLAFHGVVGLTDEEVDSAHLYGDEKEGVVVRFKVCRPLKLDEFKCVKITTVNE